MAGLNFPLPDCEMQRYARCMLRLPASVPLVAAAFLCALTALQMSAAVPAKGSASTLAVEGVGKGAAPLDGTWQFHLGDDSSWAGASIDDSAWEQITADTTWGAQTHPAYVGFAWYRKHIHIATAPGAEPDIALFIRHIDDAYEIYWNGQLIGHYGGMPPHPKYYYNAGPQTFGLGSVRDGVLAIRVWKAPLMSFDSDQLGGFVEPPLIGSPTAIAEHKAASDYTWLRSRQYNFAIHFLEAIILLIAVLSWLRNRSQLVLLALSANLGSALGALILTGLRLPLGFNFAIGWLQPVLSVTDIGLWYLLLYLLRLDNRPRITRFTHYLAIISIVCTSLDGALTLADWSNPAYSYWAPLADGILTAIFTTLEAFPLVLVGFAIGKRLAFDRWFLAAAACLDGMVSIIRIAVQQGSRFTHWTIGQKIGAPIFTINGNVFNAQTLADTLLLIAIVYAVYRYTKDAARRQSALEQEFRSARELQQVLVPEALPALPGFDFTSAYRPAQEVGGDFFQVIPLDGPHAGSTLILVGDVSGKGLKAAMTVALIVGAVRTVARFVGSPAAVLTELNTRLHGRMRGGFATCLALLIGPDGSCVLASAGHPAPYLNDRPLELPGALPLGVLADAVYEERTFQLAEGDHCTLYTDGLLEARSHTGEIFSFDRLDALFSTAPSASEATLAAVDFGQEDDITVLTLTRRSKDYAGATQLVAPALRPA